MTSFNPFENDTRKKSPSTGPRSLWELYKHDIFKAIAYYEGRYVPKEKEHIIPKEYVAFLSKLI